MPISPPLSAPYSSVPIPRHLPHLPATLTKHITKFGNCNLVIWVLTRATLQLADSLIPFLVCLLILLLLFCCSYLVIQARLGSMVGCHSQVPREHWVLGLKLWGSYIKPKLALHLLTGVSTNFHLAWTLITWNLFKTLPWQELVVPVWLRYNF